MAKQFKLKDGRNLQYDVSGAKDGFPLIWIHGTPGAHTVLPVLGAACEKKGLQLVTFSRAGYADSSRCHGRSIVDITADIEALLHHLGHDQCYVGGWSGGGPHALACAARLKGCIASLVIATVAPYDAEGLDFMAGQGQDNVEETEASLKGEDVLRQFCEAQRKDLMQADVTALTEMLATILPEVDKKTLLENDEMGHYAVNSFKDGLKNNCDGWIDDDLSFIKPWGFDVSEAKCPVFLYHGSADLMCPYSHGQWIASHLPKNSTKHLLDGHGHLSVVFAHMDEMIDELLSVAR